MFIKLNLLKPKMLILFENAHIRIIEKSAKNLKIMKNGWFLEKQLKAKIVYRKVGAYDEMPSKDKFLN